MGKGSIAFWATPDYGDELFFALNHSPDMCRGCAGESAELTTWDQLRLPWCCHMVPGWDSDFKALSHHSTDGSPIGSSTKYTTNV